jgi:hypothetical protein
MISFGTSPIPCLTLALLTPLTSLPYPAQAALSSVLALSAYAVHKDKDSGPSTATAWGLVYFATLAKHANKNKSGKLFTLAMAASTFSHAREMAESYF